MHPRGDQNTVRWLLTAFGEDWFGDSRGRVLVSLGPTLKLSKHPLWAILTVAFLPIFIEAYDMPLCTNKILTLFLWCGLRLQAFCKAFYVQGCALHRCLQGFLLTRHRSILRAF